MFDLRRRTGRHRRHRRTQNAKPTSLGRALCSGYPASETRGERVSLCNVFKLRPYQAGTHRLVSARPFGTHGARNGKPQSKVDFTAKACRLLFGGCVRLAARPRLTRCFTRLGRGVFASGLKGKSLIRRRRICCVRGLGVEIYALPPDLKISVDDAVAEFCEGKSTTRAASPVLRRRDASKIVGLVSGKGR